MCPDTMRTTTMLDAETQMIILGALTCGSSALTLPCFRAPGYEELPSKSAVISAVPATPPSLQVCTDTTVLRLLRI
jgi:hypothetical protein